MLQFLESLPAGFWAGMLSGLVIGAGCTALYFLGREWTANASYAHDDEPDPWD